MTLGEALSSTDNALGHAKAINAYDKAMGHA